MNLDALQYVCGNTGHVINPVLRNLLVYMSEQGDTRMQAQDGRFTTDAPTDLPCMLVNAERLQAVWAACTTPPKVSITSTGLTITAGRMRARVSLLDATIYPRDTPNEATSHDITGLIDVFTQLLPFVASDASRPWATSICLTPTHAYATNNVVLVRRPIDIGLTAPVNVPGASVEALLNKRQGGALINIGASKDAITFYLESGTWVKTQLIDGEWPTNVVDGLVSSLGDQWLTVNPGLEPMLKVAASLADARYPVVAFKDGSLYLEDDSLIADALEPLPTEGKMNAKMADLVFTHAHEVQWHTPKKDVHAFRHGELLGVFGGQRS